MSGPKDAGTAAELQTAEATLSPASDDWVHLAVRVWEENICGRDFPCKYEYYCRQARHFNPTSLYFPQKRSHFQCFHHSANLSRHSQMWPTAAGAPGVTGDKPTRTVLSRPYPRSAHLLSDCVAERCSQPERILFWEGSSWACLFD